MKIGDKVVCVDDSYCGAEGYKWEYMPKRYIKGEIYVIRGWSSDKFKTGIKDGLLLIGIKCIWPPTNTEYGLPTYRFRLLDEMKAEAAKKNQLVEIK